MHASMDDVFQYSVCLVGDAGVGKTSIFNCARGEDFSKSPTVNTDRCLLNFVVKNEHDGKDIDITIELCDTAGQERWRSLTESYYRDVKAIIIVFAVDNHESFSSIYRDIKHIKDNDYSPNALYFLVGNKIDLHHEDVSQAKIEDFQKSHRGVFSAYVRTSAKKRATIEKLFKTIAQTLVSKHVSPTKKKRYHTAHV